MAKSASAIYSQEKEITEQGVKPMGKRQELRERRKKQQQTQRIMMIVGVTFVALAIALIFILPNLPKDPGEIVLPEPYARPQADFNAAGDPNAPIRIDEFSDFQCPYCQRFYLDTEKQLMETYVASGQVYFVYNSFGYFIGNESGRSAEAAYCAGDQDKYWEMHDIIFVNWNGENQGAFADYKLEAFAEKIGLDMPTFRECFDSGVYRDLVDEDAFEGQQAGIRATPSFVMTYTVNGEKVSKLIEGAQLFSGFQQEIEAALAAINGQ